MVHSLLPFDRTDLRESPERTPYCEVNLLTPSELTLMVDDLPPMLFIKKAPNSHGWVNPRDVEDLWRDHFDYFYREYDKFCFP